MSTLKEREAAEAAALLDALCAARPLKPPPMPRHEQRERSTGAWVLANEIREGLYDS